MFDDKKDQFVTYNGKKVLKRSMWSKTSPDMLNGATLNLHVTYSTYQKPIRKNIYFVGDDSVIYLSGRHIVEYDIIRKKQSFITKNIDDDWVTCMNYYKTKNGVKVAVGIQGVLDVLPRVKVYSTLRDNSFTLLNPEFSSSSVVLDLVFGLKGKYILVLSELERYGKYDVTLWQVDKERSVGRITVPKTLSKVDVNPKASGMFSVSGYNYFKLFTYDQNEKVFEVYKEGEKVFETLEKQDVIDHCWIPEYGYVVAATRDSTIFVYSLTEMIMKFQYEYFSLDTSKKLKLDEDEIDIDRDNRFEGYAVYCIERTNRGFVLGLEGIPAIAIYEIDRFQNLVNLGSFRTKEEYASQIFSVSTSADDLYLAITLLSNSKKSVLESNEDKMRSVTMNRLMSTANLSMDDISQKKKLDLFIFNKAIIDAVKSVTKDPYEPILDKGSHCGPIKSLAICPTKTIIASLADDSTLKLWEFGNDYKEIFSRFFHDNPQCVAIHPLSFQLAIGFSEGLRFYYFLEEDLKLAFTQSSNIRACTAVQYSEGGHFCAAGNGQNINVYDPYTFQVLKSLPGHSGALKDIQWIANDKYLLTTCSYGFIFCWGAVWDESDHREFDLAYRNPKCYCVTYDLDYDIVVACCDDGKTRLITEKGTNVLFEYDSSPFHHTAVCISKKHSCIFFGTSQGSVRVYLWPLTEFHKDSLEFIEFPIHQTAVTNIQVTHDFSSLITSSEDGSIFLSKIREVMEGNEPGGFDVLGAINNNARGREIMGKFVNAYLLNSLTLVGRANMEAKKDSIKDLEDQIQNAKSDVDDEKEKLINYYTQKVKSLEEKNRDTIIKHKEVMAQAMEDASDRAKKLGSERESLHKKYTNDFNNYEEKHKKALLQLYAENDSLKAELEALNNFCESESTKFKIEYNDTLQEAENELVRKYQALVANYNSAVGGMKLDEKKFKEALQQSEQDYEEEYKNQEEKLIKELNTLKKTNGELRTNNSKLGKEIEDFRRQTMKLENMIRDVKSQNEQLEKDRDNFEERKQAMQRQLNEREEIINEKEKQIKEFRNKNAHLHNFRSVYDHRVTTLNEEHTPLVDHLDNMEKHIKTIYKELLEEAQANKRLREILEEKETKIDQLQTMNKKKAEMLSIFRRANEVFEFDIHNLTRDANFDNWEEPLKRLKDIYTEKVKNLDDYLFSSIDPDPHSVFAQYKDKHEEDKQQTILQAIKDELSRQRDFMNKKLLSVAKFNERGEKERQDAQIRIQNENTNLINECNFLRKEKHIIQNKIGMLEKQARDLARDLNDSYLDQYRTKTQQKTTEPILDKIDASPLKKSKELPFQKYKSEQKLLKPISQSLNGDQIKKTQTNDILYSLLKEIDKFNDAQVRGKMFESAELIIKPGKVTVHPLPHLEGARMEDTFKGKSSRPPMPSSLESEGNLVVNVEDQTMREKADELLKGWDPRKTNEIDSGKAADMKKKGGFLSGSSDNSSIEIKKEKKLY